MLGWVLFFLMVAGFCAIIGFVGVASIAGGMAKVLLMVLLVLFLISLVVGFRPHTYQ